MPRPKSKEELIALSNKNYQKLIDFIEALSPEDQASEFAPGTLNRNIRDILTHLHQWHVMLLGWNEAGLSGEKPEMPAKGYTWQTLPDLNKRIWEDYQQTSLMEARKLFDGSFAQVQALIEAHSNDELFEKKRYKWTGSTSIGAYLISATSSHYDWALKLIKKGKK